MQKHALLTLTAAAMLSASPVFAHARLQSTSPAAGAQLTAAPRSLTLKFNEKAQLAVLKLTVAGKDIPVALDRGAAPALEVTVALPALPAGICEVQWSAISADDGHVTKGVFSFVIAAQP